MRSHQPFVSKNKVEKNTFAIAGEVICILHGQLSKLVAAANSEIKATIFWLPKRRVSQSWYLSTRH